MTPRVLGPWPPSRCSPSPLVLSQLFTTRLCPSPRRALLPPAVCYDNKVEGILPHYIAVDRPRRSIVLAVRGSLSLRDVVTDLLCAPAPMDIPGVDGRVRGAARRGVGGWVGGWVGGMGGWVGW